MSIDLQTQLREYFEDLDASLPDVDPTDVRHPVRPGFDARQPIRFGWAVALLAAAAVLVVVGGLTLLVRGDPEPPAITDPVPTTVPPPTTITTPTTIPPSTTEEASPLTWSPLEGAGLDDGQILTVASTDHGWMIGGQRNERDAAVWVSADASNWTVAADVEGAFGDALSPYGEDGWRFISGFASRDGRTVAVGFEDLAVNWAGGAEHRIAAAWYSDDGESWRRVEHDPGLFDSFAFNEMRAVVATSTGFVAVGTDVWTSPDGQNWERHELQPGTAYSIIATDRGLIAAGTTGGTDAYSGASVRGLKGGEAAAWTSSDGVTWSPAVVETAIEATSVGAEWGSADFARSWIRQVTETASGFVGVGTDEAMLGGPTVWVSADGVNWDLAWTGPGNWDTRLQGVAADGDRVVAVGIEFVWWSDDGGSTWHHHPDSQLMFGPSSQDRPESLDAIIETGDGFLVAGSAAQEPTIWLATWKE